ncbi:hypothetical protein [Dishui Lake phycodnavirus 2]|nr:hypothetical protein [Dishui Lake phycodnavirus 2]
MWQVFILLYFSYLVLGPHWIAKLVRQEPLDIVTSPGEFFRRSVFISYVGLLYTAWFLYRPSLSSFMNALAVTGAATLAYYTRWGAEKTLPMHVLLNMFILVVGKKYVDTQTWVTLFLGIFYLLFQGKIYN